MITCTIKKASEVGWWIWISGTNPGYLWPDGKLHRRAKYFETESIAVTFTNKIYPGIKRLV